MSKTRLTVLTAALFALVVPQLQAQSAPWVFGLGTGLSALNTEGTMGFDTPTFGPIEGDYDLSPDEVRDFMESAIGFATMATNGQWTIKASFLKLKLGGDLTDGPEDKSPTFLVGALKDPIGANLDSIQIVKGWLESEGETHEKVYDVVWSGNRELGAGGKLPAVGSTVDVANAAWTNTIGGGELITVWADPDFDASLKAFYYARVIEIPTPRWTAYDVKYYGIEMPDEVPMALQERAYTSPIWHTPSEEMNSP